MDDIVAIQALYGKKTRNSNGFHQIETNVNDIENDENQNANPLCNDPRIDSIFTTVTLCYSLLSTVNKREIGRLISPPK